MESVKVEINLINNFEVEFRLSKLDFRFDNEFARIFDTNNRGDYKVLLSDFILSYQKLIRVFRSNIHLEPILEDKLASQVNRFQAPDSLEEVPDIAGQQISEKIRSNGFRRELKWFQKRNLSKLCKFDSCADFSVPGAGKTTVALAYYSYFKKEASKLLIISPINAYGAWEEDINKCLDRKSNIVRLQGNMDIDTYRSALFRDEEFYWVNFHALLNKEKLKFLKEFCVRNKNCTIVVDESHKGKGPQISSKLLELSIFPENKMILTGTPMPQAPSDLQSQFSFLYPRHKYTFDNELIDAFQPFYQRTNDKELGLIPLNIKKDGHCSVEPYEGQKFFYEEYIDNRLLKGDKLEQIFKAKNLKQAYMRYLRFISNPADVEIIEEIDKELAKQIREEGHGAKIDAVIKRTKELVQKGEKVLIWSSFVNNVKTISNELRHKPWGAEYIIGEIKSESTSLMDEEYLEIDNDWTEEEAETREQKIKRFKEDPECMVLIANPAAAAESMSLHYVCNYALYLDRTYNASHYLQSQKRIHRLTEGEEKQKHIEIFWLNVRASIDVKIEKRLAEKVHEMNKFLNESELSLDWFLASREDYLENLLEDLYTHHANPPQGMSS